MSQLLVIDQDFIAREICREAVDSGHEVKSVSQTAPASAWDGVFELQTADVLDPGSDATNSDFRPTGIVAPAATT